MNIISLLASVQAPNGLWSVLINSFHSGIGNFGWTIFLVTLLVKVVTSPLDFWTKLDSKKQNLVKQKCAPQVAKIKKKFGKDQKKVNIQINSLYKREGMNTGLSCLGMALHLIVTLVLFFTFFSSLRGNSAYQAIIQYETLYETYESTSISSFISKNDEITEMEITNADEANKFVEDYFNGQSLYEKYKNNTTETPTPEEEQLIALYEKYQSLVNSVNDTATKAVVNKWDEIKSSWLWIENIWVADAPVYPFQSYEEFLKITKSGGKEYAEYVAQNIDQDSFTSISNIVNSLGGRKYNGFLILAVLAAGITFLSQYISELHGKLKNKKAKQVVENSMMESLDMTMKIMKFVMPIIMLVFVLTSTASFGIYILASNIATIAIGELINLIINKITHKKQLEVESVLEKEMDRLIKKGKVQEKK